MGGDRKSHGPMAVAVVYAVLALEAATAPLPVKAESTPLLSHEALYVMKLASSEPGSAIEGASGAMSYRFADTCDGWASEIHTELRIEYDDTELRSGWGFVSWESKDGRRFRFRAHESEKDGVVSRIRGDAWLHEGDPGGTVRFQEPAPGEMSLPDGTLFPTHHLEALFDAARHGKSFLSRNLFDGASLDNPFVVSAVMRALTNRERKSAADAIGLPEEPGWQMHLAFFPYFGQAGEPDFEVTVRYREDGTTDWMVQDYGDFSIDIALRRLKVLSPPEC